LRSSSTRLRLGGALTATAVSIVFGLAGTAVAGERSQGDEHRHAASVSSDSTVLTEDTDTNDGGTADGVVDTGDNAHPSGNDRSVEPGGSGDQGSATAEPDQDGHGPERDQGGLDQADGPGGTDLADQDGNNGCGNDDDFEDDNEGRCGRPVRTPVTPPVDVDDVDVVDTVDVTVVETIVEAEAIAPGAVLGTQLQASEASMVAAAVVPTQVLGVTIERSADVTTPAVLGAAATAPTLARTGLGVAPLLAGALALLAIGFALLGGARRRTTLS
jgi:hypothetical protein